MGMVVIECSGVLNVYASDDEYCNPGDEALGNAIVAACGIELPEDAYRPLGHCKLRLEIERED